MSYIVYTFYFYMPCMMYHTIYRTTSYNVYLYHRIITSCHFLSHRIISYRFISYHVIVYVWKYVCISMHWHAYMQCNAYMFKFELSPPLSRFGSDIPKKLTAPQDPKKTPGSSSYGPNQLPPLNMSSMIKFPMVEVSLGWNRFILRDVTSLILQINDSISKPQGFEGSKLWENPLRLDSHQLTTHQVKLLKTIGFWLQVLQVPLNLVQALRCEILLICHWRKARILPRLQTK